MSLASRAARPLPSVWLVDPAYDAAFLVLPAIVALVLGALAGRLAEPDGSTPTWAWLALVVAVDVAHVHGTTLRVYLDGAELERRLGLYVAVPIAAWVVGVFLYSLSPLAFWRVLAYVAVFHFVKQQLGWMRLYRHRAGDRSRVDRFVDEAAIYVATGYPLISWHARLPRPFAWLIDGDFVAGVPSTAAAIARGVWIVVLLAFAVRQIQRRVAGQPWFTGKILLVVTTAATWWAGIVLWESDFAFTAANVLVHGIPYMAISHRYGVIRWASSVKPAGGSSLSRMLAAVFAPRRFALFALGLVALAFAEEWLWDGAVWRDHPRLFPFPALDLSAWQAIVVPLLALPQATHYVLDGYLWRLDGSNPGLAEALGLVARCDGDLASG
ncbi:MAG: hypothetical protein U0610_25000 [bacterium]